MTGAESARWWTVPQAAVWIRTRDRAAVDKLEERQIGSLAFASIAIAGTLTASACLREALRLGRFAARGRLVRPELVVASGERAYRILNEEAEPIPQSFWKDGGDFSDSQEHGVLATALGQPECWKDLAVDVDECVGHWQPPSSLLEDGKLSLNEAVGRLWPQPEDQPIWLLTHPGVRATGLNAAGAEVPISFDRPLVVDPDKNAVRTEDDRQAWSAVTLELAEAEANPQATGDPETDGMAKVRAIMDAITADRKQLRRDDFGVMVRELVDRRATLKMIDSLWRELAPVQWREQGQGSPTAGLMVEDWKAYLRTA